MEKLQRLEGAIFDVDGTLLNEYPDGIGLHERARLLATHTVGAKHGIPELQALTIEHMTEAFTSAGEHSLRGAIWRTLVMAGLVTTETIDPTHPLLVEIAQLKNSSFEAILRTDGSEVPGAGVFVRKLGAHGLRNNLAIASTACRRDIDIVLEMTGLTDYFPDTRIISIERVEQPKPHPQAFDLAFRSLGLSEQSRPHVLAFEDHPRGIHAAKTAGLFTCAITTLHDRKTLATLDVPPDLIADSFDEFATLLNLGPTER